MENKTCRLELKYWTDRGEIAGYASIFHIADAYNDIVMPSAFKTSLSKGKEVKMLWEHEGDSIGHFTKIREDLVGLFVEGQVSLDVPLGREVFDKVKNKSIGGLSIGYTAKDYSYNRDGRRILNEVDLHEVSIVSSPANPYSQIMQCKSIGLEEGLERLCRVWE